MNHINHHIHYLSTRNSRSRRGSLLAFLMILFLSMLVFIVAIISIEMYIKMLTMGRLKNAAKEAVTTYTRSIVRLRDNQLSNSSTINLSDFSCNNNAGAAWPKCTTLNMSSPLLSGVTIPVTNQNLEYLQASRILLYNLSAQRLNSPSEVMDIRQRQCYTDPDKMHFNKIPGVNLPNCGETTPGVPPTPNPPPYPRVVTSPIAGLTWSFRMSPYNSGVCTVLPDSLTSTTKQFCVRARVSGRLDSLFLAGIPFLQGINFIKTGAFTIDSIASVKKMDQASNVGDSYASSLSSEDIILEF